MAEPADQPPQKLLATGGIRTVARRVEKPILHIFPGSFNAGKATFAAQISQKARDVELRYVLHMRDNYTPEYARLNPDTMAVPTMEIDDKVCTDSMDLCMYLMDNYPGPGDQAAQAAGRKEAMLEWIKLAASWDEYMFTYGHMPEKDAEMANSIRLANLRFYLNQVLAEKPDDTDFLVEKYVQKIAGISNMKRAQEGGMQKQADLEENKTLLHRILARGNELLELGSTDFLFGDQLTTADVYFLPIFRIFYMLMPDMFDAVFEQYPNLQGYWTRALAHSDVQAGLMYYVTKRCIAYAMLSRQVPKTILAYKLGLLKAPELPEEIETRIAAATDAQWLKLRGNAPRSLPPPAESGGISHAKERSACCAEDESEDGDSSSSASTEPGK